MLVADEPSFPSAVSVFEQLGKRPVAIHPFDRHMYKRDRVYPAFGFEEFVDEDGMENRETIGHTEYISDAAAFEEVQDHLEESEQPLFVNLVTMQNHFPMAGKYDDPVGVTGVGKRTANQLGGYARGLRHSDDALREFVRGLRRSDEPTAVVLYGDHTPAFWARDRAFDDDRRLLRQTPFFLWSNVERLPAETLPLTSPVYFLPLLLDRLGVPLPPLYALLTELHEELPAMALGEYHAADGTVTSGDGLGQRARELLADYRLVQYDLVGGERYAERQLLSPVSAASEQGRQGG
jgi:phosphoglycerol transferase MdoB-like AlkP superfamily enzyme